jgi:hypothetical protein
VTVTDLIGVIFFAGLASTFAAKLPRCDHSVVTRLVFFHFSTGRRDFAELASQTERCIKKTIRTHFHLTRCCRFDLVWKWLYGCPNSCAWFLISKSGRFLDVNDQFHQKSDGSLGLDFALHAGIRGEVKRGSRPGEGAGTWAGSGDEPSAAGRFAVG